MSDSLLPYQPSLASATNTRLDTACRHHQQCRVSLEDMLNLTEGQNQEELQRQKYRYCIHKDEFVVGIGRPWNPSVAKKRINSAYPPVISNLGQLGAGTSPQGELFQKVIKYMYHMAQSVGDRTRIIHNFSVQPGTAPPNFVYTPSPYFSAADFNNTLSIVKNMFDPISVGYATTLGWAHPNSGDNMTTVMIGGLRTVMNGDFEVFTGDMLQWYWPFETDCFKANGERKDHPTPLALAAGLENVDPAALGGGPAFAGAGDREKFYERQYGQKEGSPKVVARIKPYVVKNGDEFRLYDKMRVFAVALSCARPHEMVDIKISRQSL